MYKNQNYYDIKRDCLKNKRLFEDDEFPTTVESLYFSGTPPKPYEWKRPHEIVDNPAFFVDGASRFDAVQGLLGNCWFLAGVAAVAHEPNLFSRVCPSDQTFNEDYAGIFHFQFWQYGEWIDVVVDDRLPTYNGRLAFLHSKDINEFWGALMEKAYAKINGSYEGLKGGTVAESLTDFTGGLTEEIELHDKTPKDLFTTMSYAFKRSSLMGCYIETKGGEETFSRTNSGLIRGLVYTITSVSMVELPSKNVSLVRARNPWGRTEWNGAWGDRSNEWRTVSNNQKRRLGLEYSNDGEFWMDFTDFAKEFSMLNICYLSPESREDIASGKLCTVSHIHDKWQKNFSAGGCRNYLGFFYCCPIF